MEFVTVDKFFETTILTDITDIVRLYSKTLKNNVKIKMLQRLEDPTVKYDVNEEIKKFIDMLVIKTGKSKK